MRTALDELGWTRLMLVNQQAVDGGGADLAPDTRLTPGPADNA